MSLINLLIMKKNMENLVSGHNLAFVTASEALRTYWKTDAFSKTVLDKSKLIHRRLREIVRRYPGTEWDVRGRGFIWGIDFGTAEFGPQVCAEAFKRGLIIETSGRNNVLKITPPLITDEQGLNRGLDIVEKCVGNLKLGT
ncbi:aminotransferase class III-fold pyridoxal phosphate-dependent enzyme [Desulfobacterales bacterium HSG2]|nr:aminotransferase class III-fold pyridoxal phosphate-dependent enzyme [Desulfobacterales bacterium HSG2]